MQKTLLERVAQVIRDLETVWVITDDDFRKFSLSKTETKKEKAQVTINLKRSIHDEETENEIETIKACFKQEFQDDMSFETDETEKDVYRALEYRKIEITIFKS